MARTQSALLPASRLPFPPAARSQDCFAAAWLHLPLFPCPTTQVCLEYLERYFVLICFVSYVCGAHFPPGSPSALSFGEWLAARPELRSILERLLRYNPAAALALNRSPGALAASE